MQYLINADFKATFIEGPTRVYDTYKILYCNDAVKTKNMLVLNTTLPDGSEVPAVFKDKDDAEMFACDAYILDHHNDKIYLIEKEDVSIFYADGVAIIESAVSVDVEIALEKAFDSTDFSNPKEVSDLYTTMRKLTSNSDGEIVYKDLLDEYSDKVFRKFRQDDSSNNESKEDE